ncbi:MAG: hypothetical protein SCH70_14165, partial [Candidatus Methanoperedens sp.]|nr:hypothetical protein [Candidatus Methanoperedens sp.]
MKMRLYFPIRPENGKAYIVHYDEQHPKKGRCQKFRLSPEIQGFIDYTPKRSFISNLSIISFC